MRREMFLTSSDLPAGLSQDKNDDLLSRVIDDFYNAHRGWGKPTSHAL